MQALETLETAPAAPPPSMTAAEVAAALQLTVGHFYGKRETLEAAGFPKKMPGIARWPRALVNDWISNGGVS